MKWAFAIVALCSCMASLPAQYWRKVGGGNLGASTIQTLYADSVSDRLLGGGPFRYIVNEEDTVDVMGLASWNGERWDSMAHRIALAEGQTLRFLRFQGDLYACGNWGFEIDGEENWGLARLDEEIQRWVPLACNNPEESGIKNLQTSSSSSQLYATGYPGSLCEFPVSCVFTYDGLAFAEWEPFEQIPWNSSNIVNYVFDFRGKTYMTGFFRDPLSEGYAGMMRYNGTAWEYVPGWNTTSSIKEINIKNDTLYVAGTFRSATGGPGDLIAYFDGTTWNNMGGGLRYAPVPMSGVIYPMQWFNNELWVGGRFTHAGDVEAECIARWNGQQWCAVPSDFASTFDTETTLYDMAVWRDSLYICGGFTTINGEPIRKVAQWIGGDAVVGCSTPVAVPEPAAAAPAEHLRITPFPAPHAWMVQFSDPGQRTTYVVDALGKEVAQFSTTGTTAIVDLAAHAAGLYVVRVQQQGGILGTAKILRP